MALKSKTQAETTEAKTETTTAAAPEDKSVATKVETSNVPAVSYDDGNPFITCKEITSVADGLEWGDFPSVVATNGTHMISGEDGDDLGKRLKFQVIKAVPVKKVVPGSNDDEAKQYFAVSNDGEFVGDGRSIEEALQDAKDAGYDKASVKDYMDVVARVVECASNPVYEKETVILQLAPFSRRGWKSLSKNVEMKTAMGDITADPVNGNAEKFGTAVVFTSVATPTSYKGNNFTKFMFSV